MRSSLCALLLGSALVALGCATGGARGLSAPHVRLEPSAKLLPARARRLSNFELENSLARVTGLPIAIAGELPPDVRQEGDTPNAGQDVSSAWATRYSTLISELAGRAAKKMSVDAGCHELSGPCRAQRVAELGRQAYRRSLTNDERSSLELLLSDEA